jgi:hypothetical protein
MILWSHGLVTIIMARTAIGIYLVLQLLSLTFLTKNHHMILQRGDQRRNAEYGKRAPESFIL